MKSTLFGRRWVIRGVRQMDCLTFDRWVLRFDHDATSRAYAMLEAGSAAVCGCTDCRNWMIERLNVLPAAFVTLLNNLGVDAMKETEVSEYEGGSVNPARNLYCGEYLFIGRVETGPDCYIPQSNEEGVSVRLEPLVDDFRIGFSSNRQWSVPLSVFDREKCSVVVFQVHARRGEPYA